MQCKPVNMYITIPIWVYILHIDEGHRGCRVADTKDSNDRHAMPDHGSPNHNMKQYTPHQLVYFVLLSDT